MIHLPSDPFFQAFGETAIFHAIAGDQEIQVIANFNIEVETNSGVEFATGYAGVFELVQAVYEVVKAGDSFTLNNRKFTIVRKNPIIDNTYKVVAES